MPFHILSGQNNIKSLNSLFMDRNARLTSAQIIMDRVNATIIADHVDVFRSLDFNFIASSMSVFWRFICHDFIGYI